MKNKRGNVAVIAIIIVIVAITTGVITWLISTKSQAPVQQATTQPVVAQLSATAPTPAAVTQQPTQPKQELITYKNDKLKFSFQLPRNWSSVVQNDDATLLDMFFYDNKFTADVEKTNNPLLALIDKSTGVVGLSVNSNDFVKKANFDLKNYLASGAGGPGGKVYGEKITNWQDVKANNGATIYLYEKEIQGASVVKVSGAAWVSNGRLFELKNNNNDSDTAILKQIALSFSEIK